MSQPGRTWTRVLSASLACWTLNACDRSGSDAHQRSEDITAPLASGKAPDPPISPAETVRRVHGHRVSGRLDLLAKLLLPEQERQVVALIRAVDRLMHGNAALKAAVAAHIGAGSAEAFDRAQVANMIGVFSRDVEVLSERIDGDTAVVTIQVADRVPLGEVQLVRRDGRWVIETDPPIEGLAGELRGLADVLVEAAHRLEKTPMTAAELERELALRQAAIWRRITVLIEQAPE